MAFTKPSNLFATVAFQAIAPTAGDITFSKGQVNFAGLGVPVALKDIVAFKKTVFAAGTKQVNTIDFTAIAVSANTPYDLKVRRLDTGEVITKQIITPSSGATFTTIAAQFETAIANDPSVPMTVTRIGAVLTVTERSIDTKGLIYTAPAAVVIAQTFAHVDSSGTLSEVQVYAPTVTAGDYRRYDFTVNKPVANTFAGGKQLSEVLITVWANELDGDITDFDERLVGTANNKGILTGAFLDSTSTATLRTTAEAYVEVV